MCILAGIIVLVVVTREDSRDGFKAAATGEKETQPKTTKEEREKKRKDRHAINVFNRIMSTEHSGASS